MREVFKGATSNTEYFMLVNSTTGLGETGLVYTDMTGSYTRSGAARTAITMATLASASAAYSSGGFIEVDATNCPGLYRFDVPDAAYASGVAQVIVSLKATGVKTEHLRICLIDWNKQVAAIPNVAAGANGGLPTGNASGQVVVASTAAGAIAASSFAAGAIDNAAIAADAIGSSELAASAVTEIQSGLATAANQSTILTNQATIAGYLDTEVSAIKAKTDNLPASPAATSDIPTAIENADALLNRDMASVSDTNSRTLLNAIRFIRNLWSISGTTLTVKKEDDTTTAWTATLTTNAAADPVTGSDPA